METDSGSILSSATCWVHLDKSKSILEVEKSSIRELSVRNSIWIKKPVRLVDWLNMGITEQYFK